MFSTESQQVLLYFQVPTTSGVISEGWRHFWVREVVRLKTVSSSVTVGRARTLAREGRMEGIGEGEREGGGREEVVAVGLQGC